jgi:hypothetical protein
VYAVGALSASAAPFTDNFNNLIAEIQGRLESDFPGELTKEQAKQKKALESILARLNKTTGVTDEGKLFKKDVINAFVITKLLEKTFPGEFETNEVSAAVNSWPALLEEMLGLFSGDISDILAQAGTLLESAPDCSASTKSETTILVAEDLLNQGQAALTFTDYAKFVRKAVVKAQVALKLANSALNCSTGGGSIGSTGVRMKIDGQAWSTSNASGGYNTTTKALSFGGLRLGNPNSTLGLSAINVTGPGTYPITMGAGGYTVLSAIPTAYLVTGGTVTVEVLNTSNGDFKATFSFTATGTSGSITVTDGEITVKNLPITN